VKGLSNFLDGYREGTQYASDEALPTPRDKGKGAWYQIGFHMGYQQQSKCQWLYVKDQEER
jgi:hypothetical protein